MGEPEQELEALPPLGEVDEVEEADDGEDEADEDEATEEEAAPEAGPVEDDALARVQAIDKKLDGVRKYVARKMGEILGEDAQYYVEDPISRWSGIPGWMPPMDVPPDVAAELYHLLGQHAPSDYQADTHSQACEACNGFGEVATGSKLIGQDKLPCIECAGNGWVPTDDKRRTSAPVAANGLTPSYPPPSPLGSSVPDTPAEEDPEVIRLRQLGYAVIPPMVVHG